MRYDFRSPIVFTLPEVNGSTFEGRITNISASGLCVSVGTPLPDGQEILIERNYSPFSAKRAVVRWSRRTDDLQPARYRLGLMFQGVGDPDPSSI